MTEYTTLPDGTNVQIEHMLQNYDPIVEQENQINRENVKAIYRPEFIPYYLGVKKQFNLTDKQTLLYGFVRFYCANGTNRFYFTDEQLSEILDCNPYTVKVAVRKLKNLKLMNVGHKIKANGGTIRFVKEVQTYFPNGAIYTTHRMVQNTPSTMVQNTPTNNNKINRKERKKEESIPNSQTNTSTTNNSLLKGGARTKTEKEKISVKKEKENYYVDDEQLEEVLKNKNYSKEISDLFKQFWTDRRVRDKKTCTKIALNGCLKKIDANIGLAVQMLESSIMCGYRGLFLPNTNNSSSRGGNTWDI